NRTFVALRVPVPSGATILNANFANSAIPLDQAAGTTAQNPFIFDGISSQTINANEVQYFWNVFPQGRQEVSFLFTADRRGVYPTPPVMAEAMYMPEVFGRTAGVLYSIR
ncbi:MAG: hypothetical protein FWE37_01510, partial [Spirochaetaceae bacterium]|nr:hypothetical protein [Spirochaetaceae bacterium]